MEGGPALTLVLGYICADVVPVLFVVVAFFQQLLHLQVHQTISQVAVEAIEV